MYQYFIIKKLAIKIYNASQFETASLDNPNIAIDPIGLLNLDQSNNILSLGLNVSETHLIALSFRKLNNGQSFEYNLNVIEMETIAFNQPNKYSQVNI